MHPVTPSGSLDLTLNSPASLDLPAALNDTTWAAGAATMTGA